MRCPCVQPQRLVLYLIYSGSIAESPEWKPPETGEVPSISSSLLEYRTAEISWLRDPATEPTRKPRRGFQNRYGAPGPVHKRMLYMLSNHGTREIYRQHYILYRYWCGYRARVSFFSTSFHDWWFARSLCFVSLGATAGPTLLFVFPSFIRLLFRLFPPHSVVPFPFNRYPISHVAIDPKPTSVPAWVQFVSRFLKRGDFLLFAANLINFARGWNCNVKASDQYRTKGYELDFE